jgi:hypothetical protein
VLFQKSGQIRLLELRGSLEALLLAETPQCCHRLLQKAPFSQQDVGGWPWARRDQVLESVERGAGALQVICHPAVDPGIGAGELPAGFFQQISD